MTGTLSSNLDQSVDALLRARDAHGNPLAIHSVMVSDRTNAARFDFVKELAPVDIHSLSKVVTCLTIGSMIERLALPLNNGLDTPVGPTLRQLLPIIPDDMDPRWDQVLFRHLLNCTIGHDQGFLFRRQLAETRQDTILEDTISRPITHVPGTHFSYTNVGTFLASVIVHESTGRTLGSWAQELLFDPLGFTYHGWMKYGRWDAGCSGLRLTIEDVHRIGQLVRDNGFGLDRQVVPESWVKTMLTASIATTDMAEQARAYSKDAYGYGFWICDNGARFCDGSDGQYLIFLPGEDIVICVTATQEDMSAISECFRNFLGATTLATERPSMPS